MVRALPGELVVEIKLFYWCGLRCSFDFLSVQKFTSPAVQAYDCTYALEPNAVALMFIWKISPY